MNKHVNKNKTKKNKKKKKTIRQAIYATFNITLSRF